MRSTYMSSSFQATPRRTYSQKIQEMPRFSASITKFSSEPTLEPLTMLPPSTYFICSGQSKWATGHSDSIGCRPTMEDYCVSWSNFAGPKTHYFALFDGHGGKQISQYCANRTHHLIAEYYKDGRSFTTATAKAFSDIHNSIMDKYPSAGSTAAIAIIDGDMLHTANVGDSRIVLIERGQARRLTFDHRANCPTERIKVIKRGGSIKNNRVNGVLMLSRSIGDKHVADYISTEPYTTSTFVSNNTKMIIACDGVWDVMDDQTAANIYLCSTSPQDAARKIKDEALKRGTKDNVSVMCIDLKLN
ncbi:Protein phosphatase 2C 1 [Tritrichomonas foetus]|uniref:Protein phosphatase 2C 1 n=1 Tax=Tritrichomonas foetus TaxID=1144522 RepID=A0A1J4KPP7_9EUKA|nr:Protein phosphatase 2C 1 [Tritrichomonas foetus]|eukprot:OHT13082.1 Protein phosphatase 2C 1 [Tritrichomonas foetus]